MNNDEDDSESEEESDAEEESKKPIMNHVSIKHHGAVNRIRVSIANKLQNL